MQQRIKIVSVPSVSGPRHITEQWVGLELPILSRPEPWQLDPGYYRTFRPGYVVGVEEALAVLREHRPEAAEYWQKYWNAVPHGAGYRSFAFNMEACELLETPIPECATPENVACEAGVSQPGIFDASLDDLLRRKREVSDQLYAAEERKVDAYNLMIAAENDMRLAQRTISDINQEIEQLQQVST